jgi:hypothetical protein
VTEHQLWAVLNGLMGLVCVGYGLFSQLQVRATRRWPSVAGTLLAARVTSRTWRRNTSYFVHLEYEYVVGGHTYLSARRVIGGAAPQSAQAAELVASRYNVGDTVWVFYNPARPGDAVLEHAAPAAPGIMLLGVAFLAFSLLFGFRAAT